ncbi:Peptidyl-prolyl cis-trans isomerase FKBP12 [Populus alba x Populus x berolinensis]|nr:Peptidyl-prolyl cis-trans isomerase FKBP12 [Populus alba x Populus x berolinensis]
MGVEKQVIRPGTGPKPTAGQNVTVHCTGFGKNRDLSQKFWSTKDPGQKPFAFKIGQGSVIKCRSLDGMKVSWECKWEKLLACGYFLIILYFFNAANEMCSLTMLMELVDFSLGNTTKLGPGF